MFKFTDQLGNTIKFTERPKRIISVVPSQSELLWDLGLSENLIGITKFCVHPDQMYRTINRVGGTKNLDIEKIRQLNPDLIIGNLEENEKTQIELLQSEFNVWMSDIRSFDDVFQMIKILGEIFDRIEKATDLLIRIKGSLKNIKHILSHQRVAYFIWNQPYMCAANNTFINCVLNHVGLENVLSSQDRYPELNEQELQEINPELCFLSSEPFPFEERHVKALQEILPGSIIVIVDGELFSWYGSRLLYLEKYVTNLPLRHGEH